MIARLPERAGGPGLIERRRTDQSLAGLRHGVRAGGPASTNRDEPAVTESAGGPGLRLSERTDEPGLCTVPCRPCLSKRAGGEMAPEGPD